MKKRALLILLLMLSLSFPSLLWKYSTDGAVSAKPAIFQSMAIVASDDGNIYSFDPATGTRRWKTFIGKEPMDVFIFDNGIISSVSAGKVVKLDRDGKILWTTNLTNTTYNATRIYGAAANQKEIFVSADNGVYVLDKTGKVTLTLASFDRGSTATPPAAGPDYVIYGVGSTLFKTKDNGAKDWNRTISGGSFWTSRAAIDSTTAYIGALDDKVHAFSVTGGVALWETQTRNWVMSTPATKDSAVYFGSNDGNVYAVQSGSGEILWKAQTQLAVETEPALGQIGGREAVFAGSTDKSIYAIDKDSGEVLWKGSAAKGAAGSPLIYQDIVIFGSRDKSVYAYSTERACSITNPREADVVGTKEVVMQGKLVSAAGGATVWVNINGAGWEPADTNGSDWVYYIDPKQALTPELNAISCKVVDAAGEESGEEFTSVTINQDPAIPPSNLVVTVPGTLIENVPLTVYVNDGDDGSPVERFTYSLDGKTLNGSRNFTIQASAGPHKLVVKKIGFNDAALDLNVSTSGVNPLYLAVGVILILIIIWQVWTRFLSARFAARK